MNKKHKISFPSYLAIMIWGIPLAVALFLLLFKLSDVTGLHRDECAFGLLAEMIQDGLRPVRGYFNLYTSPVHSYIIAIFFSIFGESIWSLRASGIITNLIAIFFYIDIIRRLLPKNTIWTFWFLITFPAFVVMARISGENYALNPFFLFGGIWFFYVWGTLHSSNWINKAGHSLCGLFLYLGAWNHIVTVPAIVSVGLVYLIVVKPNIKRLLLKVTPWFFLGVFIGLIPRLYGIFALGHDWFPRIKGIGNVSLLSSFLNMIYTLGGDALYIRACGEILFSFNWFLPLCALASISILFIPGVRRKQKMAWIWGVVIISLSFTGTWLITPHGMIGSRLWLIPLWFFPFIFAVALPTSPKWLRIGIGSLIVLINLLSIHINYFYNFLEDKGLAKKEVYVGGRFDNSWDFIDMRPLILKISGYNHQPIFIEDVNVHRLKYLLPKSERHRAFTWIDAITKKKKLTLNSLLAIYKKSRRRPRHFKIGRAHLVRRRKLSTDHYDVFEVKKIE